MKIRFLPIAVIAIVLALACRSSAEDSSGPVAGLIDRLMPGHSADFVIQTIPAPEGENVFEVAASNGKIALRGDSALSQCVALDYYLTYSARVSVSLYAEVPVVAPATLPLPDATVRKTTKLKDRFFLNYCTFGYSFPWWTWHNWERFIDWMALQGINMPLAQGGSEAIWQKVWRGYGLTDDEIRGYFTGPAHLAWHRMANIDNWQGPLPQSYIDGQLALTKQIVARERELGMKPVLPAFAGHVPPALKRIFPDLKTAHIGRGWGGAGQGTDFIDSGNPLFHEIQVKFLREQKKELGTDHLYGTDPFNEMAPPSWEPDFLAGVSRAIFSGMTDADPQAVWVQMAWTFQGGDWTPERLKAMIQAVPQGRMILLDYWCEQRELWPKFSGFFGAPFIWDYLGNFGGNTPLMGPVNLVNKRITHAMEDKTAASMAGIGSTAEGLNNQAMHEFLFSRAWEGATCDTEAWYKAEAEAHAGNADSAAVLAFHTFWKDVLGDRVFGNVSAVFTILPRLTGGGRGCCVEIPAYDSAKVSDAWKQMLEASPEARSHPGYQLDLADVSHTALDTLALSVRARMAAVWKKGDAAEFRRLSRQFLEIGSDIDELMGTRPEYLFGYWVNQARAWGKDPAESDYYEKNARTILTTWFGRNDVLNDYANREWNGLLKDFYLVRWKMLLDAQQAALDTAAATGKPAVDATPAIVPRMLDFEWKFAQTTTGKYPDKAEGETYEVSKRLFDKYADLFPSSAGSGALHAQQGPAALDFRGIHIDKEKGTVTFPAAINMGSGMLEYLIVAETGKTHESLLSTKIAPEDIQVAMLLLGIPPAGKGSAEPPGQLNKEYLQSAPQLKGEKVSLFLEWPGHRVRAEDLIWNLHSNAVMTEGPWTYNGSEMYEGRFLATVDGSVAALVRDSAALVNNPRPGNDDDQIWEVYSQVTPKAGTAVDVVIELEEGEGK